MCLKIRPQNSMCFPPANCAVRVVATMECRRVILFFLVINFVGVAAVRRSSPRPWVSFRRTKHHESENVRGYLLNTRNLWLDCTRDSGHVCVEDVTNEALGRQPHYGNTELEMEQEANSESVDVPLLGQFRTTESCGNSKSKLQKVFQYWDDAAQKLKWMERVTADQYDEASYDLYRFLFFPQRYTDWENTFANMVRKTKEVSTSEGSKYDNLLTCFYEGEPKRTSTTSACVVTHNFFVKNFVGQFQIANILDFLLSNVTLSTTERQNVENAKVQLKELKKSQENCIEKLCNDTLSYVVAQRNGNMFCANDISTTEMRWFNGTGLGGTTLKLVAHAGVLGLTHGGAKSITEPECLSPIHGPHWHVSTQILLVKDVFHHLICGLSLKYEPLSNGIKILYMEATVCNIHGVKVDVISGYNNNPNYHTNIGPEIRFNPGVVALDHMNPFRITSVGFLADIRHRISIVISTSYSINHD